LKLLGVFSLQARPGISTLPTKIHRNNFEIPFVAVFAVTWA